MRRAPRAISIPSPSRSIRSTSSTTSAASADAAAHRDTHIGRRKRGRVVHAVAHHHDGPVLALAEDEQDLLVRRQPGPQTVEPKPLGEGDATDRDESDFGFQRRRFPACGRLEGGHETGFSFFDTGDLGAELEVKPLF